MTMSSSLPSYTTSAVASGMPRRQRRAIRGYPEGVIDPAPVSVNTNRVSASIQEVPPLDSGR